MGRAGRNVTLFAVFDSTICNEALNLPIYPFLVHTNDGSSASLTVIILPTTIVEVSATTTVVLPRVAPDVTAIV